MDGIVSAAAVASEIHTPQSDESQAPLRLKAISCPSCGGVAGCLTPGDVLDCPYCDVSLTLVAPGVAGSAAIEPKISYEAARSVVEKTLSLQGTPDNLKQTAARRGLDLLYIPFFDIVLVQGSEEKPPMRCRLSVTRLTAVALEDDGRDVGADQVQVERLRLKAAPFAAADLASRGVVLEAQRRPESIRLPGMLGEPVTIERRVRIVYYPIWLGRFSYGRSLYHVTVDGVTGEVLRAVAPSGMKKRVLQGAAFTLLFSILIATAIASPGAVLNLLIRITDIGALLAGGLLLILAAAWDRLRFRREIVVEGATRREQPINRPPETMLEKLAAFFIGLAKNRRATWVSRGWGA